MSLHHLKSFWYHQHEVSPQDLNTENICQFSSIEHRIKLYFITYLVFHSLSGASLVAQTVKNLPANSGDTDLIPESGRSPGEGNGNPLQYSCLGNPMDRGAWWVTVCRISQSQDLLTKPPPPPFLFYYIKHIHACICIYKLFFFSLFLY